MVATMWRSLFNDRGTEFVWLDNYKQIFTDERLQTALKNNALWVLIVPAAVTAVGLVFAVLTERVSLVDGVQDRPSSCRSRSRCSRSA